MELNPVKIVNNFVNSLKEMTLNQWLTYAVLIFLVVIFLLPLWSSVVSSLKSIDDVYATSPLLPASEITFSPYVEAMAELGQPMVNSAIFTIGGTLGSVGLGSVIGYGFAK